MRALTALLAIPCLAVPCFLAAQDDSVIKVDVNLVSVLASVRSKSGALISNLQQSDFQIYEDGKEQKIKNFTRETDRSEEHTSELQSH